MRSRKNNSLYLNLQFPRYTCTPYQKKGVQYKPNFVSEERNFFSEGSISVYDLNRD